MVKRGGEKLCETTTKVQKGGEEAEAANRKDQLPNSLPWIDQGCDRSKGGACLIEAAGLAALGARTY
jgi:hypothetical protein